MSALLWVQSQHPPLRDRAELPFVIERVSRAGASEA